MGTTILTEALDLTEARLDSENRVLRDVVLIRAGMSQNRRHYSESVLQSAAHIFEGAKSFDSHAKGERRVGELTGWYSNVRYVEGKLIADRHFTRTSYGSDVWSVVEDIVNGRAPRNLAGLSINAVGKGKVRKFEDGDALEVESIDSANSVDDVTTPAAGGSYALTASAGDELATAFMNALTFEEWFQARPEFVERVQNEMKTVRQDAALRAAQADAERLQAALEDAQTTNATLTQEREAAVVEAQQAGRELVIVEALHKAQLPMSWKVDLRKQLSESDPDKWDSIIESETQKAAQAGYKPRVDVTGAGQQISPETVITETVSPLPRVGENVEDWHRRVASHK